MNNESSIYQAALELATSDNMYWCDVEYLFQDENRMHVFKPVFKETYKDMSSMLDTPQYILVDDDGYAEWFSDYDGVYSEM